MSQSPNTESRTTTRVPLLNEILCCDIHPSGEFYLSAHRNGEINVYDWNGKLLPRLKDGHTGAIMEAHFSNIGADIHSCSEDKTVANWDACVGIRKATLRGHTNGVNSVQGERQDPFILCSGSKDGTVRLWDFRESECIVALDAGTEVTATAFSENGEFIFSGGLDNDIQIWDLRTDSVVYKLEGHNGTIKGLSLSPCGAYLLSHALDNTFCIWDVRPYCVGDRYVCSFSSYQRSGTGLMRCVWSPHGEWVSAATSRSFAYVFDSMTGDVLCKVPAVEGKVNAVAFHPTQSMILTASSGNSQILHGLIE